MSLRTLGLGQGGAPLAEGGLCIIWQVVLGVLGCPNLPQEPISEEDAGAKAAGHAADSDVGVIFAARRGGGCAVGPLKSGADLSSTLTPTLLLP